MIGMKANKANEDFIKEWEKAKDYITLLRMNDDMSVNAYGKILGFLNLIYSRHTRVLKELDNPKAYWIKDKASKFTVVCSGCNYESIIWNARYCPNCGARMKEKHYEK